jgi:hypothetical protein
MTWPRTTRATSTHIVNPTATNLPKPLPNANVMAITRSSVGNGPNNIHKPHNHTSTFPPKYPPTAPKKDSYN